MSQEVSNFFSQDLNHEKPHITLFVKINLILFCSAIAVINLLFAENKDFIEF